MRRAPTIILAAGPMDYRHLPIGTNLSNAMIPVNGRPVIGWILEDLRAKGLDAATVVVRRDDERLKEFLGWAYRGRMEVEIVDMEPGGSILDSLAGGLTGSAGDGPVRVVLGDTLIRDSFDADFDFVYVGAATGARRWCLAVTDEAGRLTEFVDKGAREERSGPALAGYYHLIDRERVEESLAEARACGERELSGFLSRYGKARPIFTKRAESWFDFGHIDNLVDARRKLLAPRSFNSLRVDPLFSTITKASDEPEKLEDELRWYLELPERLRVLSPRIVSHRRRNGRLEVEQEYYGYPSLAELWVFGEMGPEFWESVIRRLLAILAEFRRHPGELDACHVKDVYAGKTFRRLDALRRDSSWDKLLGGEWICWNGREFANPFVLRARTEERCAKLAETADICIVHGDFCFSNILFDVNTQVVRLIDPRGSFGARGIHGDRRYDLAKLRHSVVGLYDYIVADLFTLSGGRDGSFSGRILTPPDHSRMSNLFDELVAREGVDPNDVRFIEALLFLSMVPLHTDHPARQRMMFLCGVEKLDSALRGDMGTDASRRSP